MSYSPTLGRFLERDPIGSPNIDHPGKSELQLKAEDQVQSKLRKKLGSAWKAERALWQFAGGANSYEFVGGNPPNNLDPSGPGSLCSRWRGWPLRNQRGYLGSTERKME